MAEPIVSVKNVWRRYPGGVVAVDNVSLDIQQNEFFALLGPSGCGKTTLLRMISGLDSPSEGQIFIGGEDMSRTPPNRRPTNMVFPILRRLPPHDRSRQRGLWTSGDGCRRG